jgi:ankyrin repeat protein
MLSSLLLLKAANHNQVNFYDTNNPLFARNSGRALPYYATPYEMTYRSSFSHYELVRQSNGLAESSKTELETAITKYLKFQIQAKYLRLVHSQAPPTHPADPARLERLPANWPDRIINSTIYKSWLNLKGLSVLHLHGTANVSDISDALVERLNQASGREAEKGPTDTLYFQFKKDDPRFCNMQAMLAFFLSATINRRARTDDSWAPNELERAYHFRGWSLDDQLDLLSFRTWSLSNDQSLMIGRLDECDDESRSWFLQRLVEMRMMDHGRASWIITSQGDLSLGDGISQLSSLDLDTLAGSTAADARISSDTKTESDTPGPIDCDLNHSKDTQNLLYCVQYAIRPMSVDELAIMMSLRDQANWSKDYRKTLTWDTVVASNSQVYLKNNEVYPHHPFSADATTTRKSHGDLTRRCLQYLQDPAVQAEIKALCGTYDHDDQTPIPLLRHNLITYAVMLWPSHYRLAGDQKPLEYVSEFFQDPRNRVAWSCAYYTLGNSVTRLPRSYLSSIPLYSMLGLDDLLKEALRTEIESPTLDIDARLALVEAARYGHSSTAELLMGTTSIDNPTLRDAVDAAASFGAGGVLHDLVNRAVTIDGFEWPLHLLTRVASLGLHGIAKTLLDSGVGTNPPDPIQGRSPLHLASLFGHFQTVKVLLEAHADLLCLAQYGRPPLHAAASGGNGKIIRILIEAGANVETPDEDELTPLQFAMTWGRTEAMEELLKAGANPNSGKEGQNDPAWAEKPLLYCARFNYIKGMQLALQHGADINCKSGKVSPLYLAVQNGNLEITRMLLKQGADPNENPEGLDFLLLLALELGSKSIEMLDLLFDHGARIEEEDNSTEYRRTALARAAGNKDVNIVKYLLKRGADVNHAGKNSHPPIYAASWSSNIDSVRVLLKAGADVNALMVVNNWRPVISAYDNPRILRLLLKGGGDVNAISDDGTCLHMAVLYGFVESVKVLLEHKPKVDLETPYPSSRGTDSDDGYTALSLACDKGIALSVQLLLEAGANRNHRTRLGKRPLDICVLNGNIDAASVLLECRVPIDYTDDKGNTVLHHISNSTSSDLVRKLVNAGADLHLSNKNGVTPLQVAVEAQNIDVVEYLLSKNADPSQCSNEAHSLLHIACDKNDLSLLRVLAEKCKMDLQLADSIKGAPSLLMTLVETWREPNLELLAYLVETGKVDLHRRSGYLEYPLLATCAFRHKPQIRYLLEHGANPDIKDSSGRRPLHFAALATDLVDDLMSFNVETLVNGQPPRDKMGRSPIHFAAVGGHWDVFEGVSKLYDESELTMPDNDGWTPLFWALLNDSVDARLVEHLIKHGADLWARVKSRKAEWSPLKLARYIGVSQNVCNLLVPDPLVRVIGPKDREERWDEQFHVSRKAATNENRVCDSCRVVSFVHISAPSEPPDQNVRILIIRLVNPWNQLRMSSLSKL